MRTPSRLILAALTASLLALGGPAAAVVADDVQLLVFSKTAAFRHGSIPDGVAALQGLGAEQGWTVDATEDAAAFTDENLAKYDAVIWLSTTGDVLDDTQQGAFERYIRAGGGYVGIHAASDTEYGWSWYGELVGAYFAGHPAQQTATITVADAVHPSTSMLPQRWERFDEWYAFQENPRGDVHVLASIEESTYDNGGMGVDHPIAWCQDYDGGRSWYTAGGHTNASYTEPLFLDHLKGGIESVIGLADADCGGTDWSSYTVTPLVTDSRDPVKLDVADDGRVFYAERVTGEVRVWDPRTDATTTALTLDLFNGLEDGLVGIALDPDFPTDPWIYLYYGAPGASDCAESDTHATSCGDMQLSRFTVDGNTIDPASEAKLLSVPSQRDTCCHSAGGMDFDSDGNLYLSTGDNTNPFASSGYTPTDERDGRSSWDAQRTSANTNDLRGKVLRIHPEDDGSYTIPDGNLFAPGTELTRAEIYAMGFRNPYTITVDPTTDGLAVADYGPDAGLAHPLRGPEGRVEWNLITEAGNYGWPYCVAANTPYHDYNFQLEVGVPYLPPPGLMQYSCDNPVNDSPNNTGLTALPPAQPATMWLGRGGNTSEPTIGSGGAPMAGPVFRHTDGAGPGSLPAYFDGTAFFMEWNTNRLFEIKLDSDGGILDVNPFLNDRAWLRPHDMTQGPDGALYMIEWGSGFGGGNENSQIVRIAYDEDGNTDGGAAPLRAAAVDGGPGAPAVVVIVLAVLLAVPAWRRAAVPA